jgi:hypothetical protein
MLREKTRQFQGSSHFMKRVILVTYSRVRGRLAGRCISLRKPGLSTTPVCVVFVADNVALGKVSLQLSFHQYSTLILSTPYPIFFSPMTQQPVFVGPYNHGMPRPQFADGETASDMEDRCE